MMSARSHVCPGRLRQHRNVCATIKALWALKEIRGRSCCRPGPKALKPWQHAQSWQRAGSKSAPFVRAKISIGNKLLMLPNFIRYSVCARNVFAPKNNFSPRRKFSIISVHTSFPASLYRFQSRRSSGLFDYKQDSDIEDRLKVLADRLVYPRISKDVPCRCCLLFCRRPNSDIS